MQVRTHAPRLLEGYDARLGQGGDNQPPAGGAEVTLLPVGPNPDPNPNPSPNPNPDPNPNQAQALAAARAAAEAAAAGGRYPAAVAPSTQLPPLGSGARKAPAAVPQGRWQHALEVG